MSRSRVLLLAIAFPASLMLIGQEPEAFSTGVISFSGNPDHGGIICNACHSGGVAPTVVIEGPDTVAPGATNTYTLRISGGQQTAGGLNVSASLGDLAAVDPGTYVDAGEITHSQPRAVDGNQQVVFTFNWTAPLTEGQATLYGAGNSVNLNSWTTGDRAGSAVFPVDVAAGPATPGEAAGPAIAPLLVTDYDESNDELSITYGTACETTDNNIYFGLLEDVGSLTWAGEVCSIGNSGSYSGFDPGTDSYFFLVVGNRDADEGSYGRALLPDATTPERAPFGGNSCGQAQTLASPCAD